MADTKISALTAASTPLVGTEVLPIVQSGVTVKVAVSDLTAGRAVSASGITTTGNSNLATTSGNVGVGTSSIINVYGKNLTIRGTGSAGVGFGDGTREWVFGNNSGNMQLYDNTAAASRLTVNSTGDLNVQSGNLVIGTSGKGIDFSATPGTGTSELLNDYEEGSWTPADASGAGLSITVNSARYTKIGRIVTCAFDITYPATADVSGVKISGLPFTSASAHSSGYAHGYTDSNTAPVFLVLGASAVMDGLNYNFSTSISNAQFSGKNTKGLVTYYV
jgi:hypothetical protein